MVGLQLSSGSAAVGSTLGLLYPWAAALSDSCLPSFCSACFASCSSTSAFLCSGPCNGGVIYCSAKCMDLDLPVHLRSAECCLLSLTSDGSYDFASLGSTCDLRVALRLLACHETMDRVQHFLRSFGSDDRRLGGLLSNRSSLLLLTDSHSRNFHEQEEARALAMDLKAAVTLMHRARNDASIAFCVTKKYETLDEILLLEEVICQVLTNGVSIELDPFAMASENNNKSYRSEDIGTGVYDPFFSWIDHSCCPNVYYTFLLGNSKHPEDANKTCLVPNINIECVEKAWGLNPCEFQWTTVSNTYGPRVLLRSICDINDLEPVFISYTSLLQPKNMRKMELWIKYRFDCDCKRCKSTPVAYADDMLERIGFPGNYELSSKLQNALKNDLQRGLTELLDNDNPLSCCEVLEQALFGILKDINEKEFLQTPEISLQSEKQHSTLVSCSSSNDRVHVMHHLCLDIYMVLSSSYKILGSGYKNEQHEMCSGKAYTEKNDVSGFVLASAAYTLILAGCVQNLYESGESGLINTLARFWLEFGELLIRTLIEIDAHFHIDSTRDHNKLRRYLLEPDSFWKELPQDVKERFNGEGGIKDLIEHTELSSNDVLRNLVHSIWPLLQTSSLFLSSIRTPFDACATVILKSKNNICRESWTIQRTAVFLCAIVAMQHSFNIQTICYGCSSRCIEVFQNIVHQIDCVQR